jgi:superfamily II DNA or RNA helicase
LRIISNSGNSRVVDLFEGLPTGANLEIATDRVSLFGAASFFDRLPKASDVRVLLDGGRDGTEALIGSEADRRLRNELRSRALARKIHGRLADGQVRNSRLPLGQSLILAKNCEEPVLATAGNCPLTTSGLGLAPQEALGFVQQAEAGEELEFLSDWFEQQWSVASEAGHAHALLWALGSMAEEHDPRTIYYRALHELFADMGEGTDEERIVKGATGIRETRVWSKLYRFQRDGIVGAIDKLQRFGGCIIADSVGLGKTFEALAVIKYFELRNDRVLVLAPKRLRENWTLWTQNDVRNDLASDRFGYDVLNHTDLSRNGGTSGEIDLSHVNWGNYDLLVIDESHNFRNRPSGAERDSRYDRLMNWIVKAGVKTRVLMLSATPVNNRLNDLKNQIAFGTSGDDAALAGHGIASIATTIRLAQSQFRKWQELPDDRRTSAKLLEMLGFDYFRLLDLLTIARSRKHIEKYYGTAETGTFPNRLPPRNVKADTDLQGRFPAIGEINSEIRRLSLAAFAPLRYVLPTKREAYDRRYNQQLRDGEAVFRQLDREESLVALMRVNLLKRMESSVHSFALTIERQLAEVTGLIERIDAHDEGIEAPDVDTLEEDDPLFDELGVGRRVKVLLSDVDLVKWRQDLTEDRHRLNSLVALAREITPERDAKLAELRQLIAGKVDAPFNSGNRKLLVFTAFADTAAYLYQNLKDEYPLHMALITGTGANKTTHPRLKTDLATLLSAFAPQARNRPERLAAEGELDLIIATDCISEGQNLQDCDCVVNYDIHWNPVRIVQRFGRVDRLGSPNPAIQLVNFWPNLDLDTYIGLERSVAGKMKLLDVSATGEENVIEAEAGDRMNDLEYRRKQLEALQSRVVDLEDLSSGVTITDMTLNDLRLDLAQLSGREREQVPSLPLGLYAPLTATPDFPPGALFVLKAATSVALNAIDPQDPLRPHVLVYLGMDESVIVSPGQPKQALDLLRLAADYDADAKERAWKRFDAITRKGERMDEWQRLLAAAIRTVTGKADERAVESLFTSGGTRGAGGNPGLDDWEVVSWLAILPDDR